MKANELSNSLSRAINSNLEFLKGIKNPSLKPQPDKWSAKQIIGHLIDSANNNHRRFVKAQYQNNLIFIGYEQESWVEVQDYQNLDWLYLLEMWKTYNLFICRIIENISEDKLNKMTTEHNYHNMAWGKDKDSFPLEGEPSNLAFLIEDYIGHLKHHITQIKEMDSSST